MIKEFQGDYRWLSNMVMLPQLITDDYGIKYASSENFYQASKSLDRAERERIARLNPYESKKQGRRLVVRSDWESVKDFAMLNAVRKKFNIPQLAEKLLATGDELIQEGNYWGDTYWGVNSKTGEGLNKLGKILMEVRLELKSKYRG